MCDECEGLRIQIVDLRARVKALRIMVQDLGGMKVEYEDDPYEDEQPIITWEPKE
jgi:hypothetical protein